jgi:HSP20 family protein
MATKALARTFRTPSFMEDFFKPWNEFFDTPSVFGKMLTIPAVNVKEDENQYMLSLAVPGFTKEDFKIDVEANMLTISSEKEEKMEEKEEEFTRREYNFSSFSRTFNLPEDVKQDAIEANYKDGLLMVKLPRKEEAKMNAATKHIMIK